MFIDYVDKSQIVIYDIIEKIRIIFKPKINIYHKKTIYLFGLNFNLFSFFR